MSPNVGEITFAKRIFWSTLHTFLVQRTPTWTNFQERLRTFGSAYQRWTHVLLAGKWFLQQNFALCTTILSCVWWQNAERSIRYWTAVKVGLIWPLLASVVQSSPKSSFDNRAQLRRNGAQLSPTCISKRQEILNMLNIYNEHHVRQRILTNTNEYQRISTNTNKYQL